MYNRPPIMQISLYQFYIKFLVSSILFKYIYLKYIPAEKQEEIHQSLLRDIYYFYNGVKVKEVIQKNGEITDVSRENLGERIK